MKISIDTKELLSSYFTTFLECYKIFMACLLSIFVPQYCEETHSTCSLSENFANLSRFNEFVIFFNFLTLGFFLNYYYVQSKRETYMITHLDINKDKSDHSLKENLTFVNDTKQNDIGQRIYNKIKFFNMKIYKLTIYTVFTFILNTLFSCVLIFYYFYDGFRSVTTLIANVLLVSQKLYSVYCISLDSLNDKDKQYGLSLTKLEPSSYNDIDSDYLVVNNRKNSMIDGCENIELNNIIITNKEDNKENDKEIKEDNKENDKKNDKEDNKEDNKKDNKEDNKENDKEDNKKDK